METKVVYVVISGMDDIYFEQVWASAWSLKYFNPDAYITLLTDDDTKQSIYSDTRKCALEFFDEIKVVEFDREYSSKEKSRWIKTNMRNLIEGDFLFVDADTIVCGDLSGIDGLDCSIGAVLDENCQSREICDYFIFRTMYPERLKQVYGVEYTPDVDVFNSGVLFVKDDAKSHQFFDKWHENWLRSLSKGYVEDQLPLVKTCMDLNCPITEISGEYNCQICVSIQYLCDAKIIHTFASQGNSGLSPIVGSEIYKTIKRNGGLTDEVKSLFLNCKRSFVSPSPVLNKKWIKLRFLPANLYLQEYMDSEKMYDKFTVSVLNFLARTFGFLRRHIYK